MRSAVCIPVFDDWESALMLLQALDRMAEALDHPPDVLLVDDGSNDPVPETLERDYPHLGRIWVLMLRRNVGHQRAIAIGLTYLYVEHDHEAVVVMDGDGEDDPGHVRLLLAALADNGATRPVFARRTKRLERLGFRVGYACYKVMHRIMTGRGSEVGNFSAVPRATLARLVAVSEMWNHYAAAVVHARVGMDTIPLARARRYAGRSKMNMVALVTHGLSAISIFGDVIGARLLMLALGSIALAILGMVAVVGVRFGTGLAIPGWATNAMGLLLIALLNLCGIAIISSVFILRARSQGGFLPLRDHALYIAEERTLRDARR